MRCPYCSIEINEYVAECPNCRLTLPKVNSLLGAVPRLSPGLDDALHLINKRDYKTLKGKIARIKRRFPQVSNHLIVRVLPTKYPFDLYLFWFFNSAGLSEASSRGGENYDVLLLIDPQQMRAGIMVGYGLQYYLPQTDLDEILKQVEPVMSDLSWMEALVTIYDTLDEKLEAAALELSNSDHQPVRIPSRKIIDY